MNAPFSLTTQQVDIINRSLERALALAELLVDCGPMEKSSGELSSKGSLTAVFQMMVDELSKIDDAMKAIGE